MSGGVLPLLVALLTADASSSQVLPVSGRLTTQDGRPVLAAYDVTFELLEEATSKDALWSETQNIAFEGGFFTAYLGSVKKLPETLLREHRDLHLRITVDGDVLAPFPLGAVPYAFSARLADDARTLDGQTAKELIDSFPDVARSGAFADLTGVPEGLADGDDDLLASLPCAPGQIPRRSGETFTCSADLDTLGALTCQSGEVARWNGFVWGCTTDRVLTESEVDALVANNGYAAATSLARVATTGAFADLGGIPAGLSDGDDDLLAAVPCGAGSLLAYAGSAWACVPTYAAASPLVLSGANVLSLAPGGVLGTHLAPAQLGDTHLSATAAIAPAKIAGTAATLTGPQAFDGTTLVIDAANDRVGIGTGAPAVKLAVEGAVRATSLEVTPRAQVLFLDPGHFLDVSGTTMRTTSTGLVAPEPIASAATGAAQATLSLRPGEELRRVTCLVFDNQIRFDAILTFELNRRPRRRAAPTLVSTASVGTSSASASAHLATVNLAAGSVVAVADEVFVIGVTYERLDSNAGGSTGAFGFGGCEVEIFTSAP